MLKKGSDGLYHIYDTTAYEGSPLFNDSITDLSAIRSLFSALAEVLPKNEKEIYSERLSHLADFTSVEMDDEELEKGRFVYGLGKGKECAKSRVLSVGTLSENNRENCADGYAFGEPVRKTFGTLEKNLNSYYGFPDAEFAPIYPSGLVGIKDKGTELYSMLLNSIYMHHPAPEKEGDDTLGMCMGWCMMPIYLARMGLGKELKNQLKRTISTWIAYPQGFGLYGGYEGPEGRGANTKRSTRDRLVKMDILKIDGEYKDRVINFDNDFFNDKPEYHSTMNLWNFRHFDYETLPITANAINEMLLQSYDGCLMLFGAIEKDDEIAFKLAAQGGFEVCALYQKGEFAAEIESIRGNELNIVFENINGRVKFYDCNTKCELKFAKENETYILKTSPGMKILAMSEKGGFTDICRSYDKNNKAKHLGDATLGNEKEF